MTTMPAARRRAGHACAIAASMMVIVFVQNSAEMGTAARTADRNRALAITLHEGGAPAAAPHWPVMRSVGLNTRA